MSLFTNVVSKIPKRNRFHQPFESILSADYGKITPAGIVEMDPGNTFIDQVECQIKVAPMKAPAFGRIDAYLHFFFVPRRLLYDEFEQFITGGVTGTFGQDVSELTPVAPCFDFEELVANDKLLSGSLADYLGMPSIDDDEGDSYPGIPPIDAMPWAAYHKIFSDWYRDELLDTEEFEPLSGGKIDSTNPLFVSLNKFRYRAWKKDYFTSARPDTQLGAPVGVPITGDLVSDGPFRLAQAGSSFGTSYFLRYGLSQEDLGTQATPARFAASVYEGDSNSSARYPQYFADGISLDNALMMINDWRTALKTQMWKEKNMRGGNRYIENIFHHFGVKSSDARLQRAQYLGGRKIPVVIGEVLQSVDTRTTTEGVTTGNPLGQRAGIANAGGNSQRIKFFAEEHGFVFCLLSILPHAAYFQGIPRMFAARWDPMDYVWPEFGNLGEQEVYNWELFVDRGANPQNSGVFGYQSRYADRKYRPNEIHGEFRKGQMTSWHTARIFENRPNLNKNFIYFSEDVFAEGQNRIFVVESNELASHFYVHLWHNLTLVQHLPKYGIPF